MYSYYKNYKEFLDEYPKFKSTLISFDTLKIKIPRIRNWFKSQECLDLPNDSVLSNAFWKNPTVAPLKSAREATEIVLQTNQIEALYDDAEYTTESEATGTTQTETQTGTEDSHDEESDTGSLGNESMNELGKALPAVGSSTLGIQNIS